MQVVLTSFTFLKQDMERRNFLKTGGVALGGVAVTTNLKAVNVGKTNKKPKEKLWLLISSLDREDIHLAVSTIAWIADKAGVKFENYLEAQRDGKLFARTGSTVLGGFHHQQFNYLNSVFDVEYIIFGEAPLFRSSIEVFNNEVIVETGSLTELYNAVLEKAKIKQVNGILFGPTSKSKINDKELEIGPYLYADIYNKQLLAFSVTSLSDSSPNSIKAIVGRKECIYLSDQEKRRLLVSYPDAKEIDGYANNDDYGTITLRIAARWKSKAKGVAFADPSAILSQIPKLCREKRIAVYAPAKHLKSSEIIFNGYQEAFSGIVAEVAKLTKETGNLVMVGRQTTDGDLIEWAKDGVCLQIMDPNRPAFPIVETVPHIWTKVGGTLYDEEPDDDQLRKFAKEGKVLNSLFWHSGEMAHNEAMINLFDLISFTGIKFGIGVHAARYETAPQLWEMINISRSRGGVRGYVEPVLYSGGMGIMAEINCPPSILTKHCNDSLSLIRNIARKEAIPRGHHAFLDSDLASFTQYDVKLFQALEKSGLDYAVTTAMPGRNKILYKSDNFVVINQTPRHFYGGSPFVRIRTLDEYSAGPTTSPGWLLATIDSPVHAFTQYIWKNGQDVLKLVEYMIRGGRFVNVLPHTIARYARILKDEGYLPE